MCAKRKGKTCYVGARLNGTIGELELPHVTRSWVQFRRRRRADAGSIFKRPGVYCIDIALVGHILNNSGAKKVMVMQEYCCAYHTRT